MTSGMVISVHLSLLGNEGLENVKFCILAFKFSLAEKQIIFLAHNV